MAFVMALVLLFTNVGVTCMAAEPDDGLEQEESDEEMEIVYDDDELNETDSDTDDEDESDGEVETLFDEDEPDGENGAADDDDELNETDSDSDDELPAELADGDASDMDNEGTGATGCGWRNRSG